MKGFQRVCGLFLFALLFGTHAVLAQATATAELRGQVTDPNGAVIAGAKVTATDTAKGTTRTVTTDEGGGFVILPLLPSNYSVKVEANGFAARNLTGVVLEVGQQFNLPIQLTVNGVSTQIDIVQGEEVVQTERTQQSDVITTRQIENLPINRRNFLDFALLTPGVISSERINDATDARVAQTPTSNLSFAGNNGRGNSITVDGADADTASGGAHDVLSQEGVQEFQINRNAYSAEYGGASGGIVNIVSKSGANKFHGSAFAFFRDKRFDAKNVFDGNPNGKSPFNRQQFGGSLGGRIIEDKTFFFVAAEGLRQNLTSFVNLSSSLRDGVTLSTGQNAYLAYLRSNPALAPIANSLTPALTVASARTTNLFNTASGQFPFKASSSLYSGRIDHTFNSNDTAFARLNYAHSYSGNQSAGALDAVSRGELIESRGSQVLLSETHLFNPTTINEIKGLFSYYDLFLTPNDTIGPSIDIGGFGFFNRQIFQPSRTLDKRYELSDNLSLVRGSHTVKIGGLIQRITVPSVSETYGGGRFQFGALPISLLLGANAAAVSGVINADPTLTPAQRAGLLGTTINALQAYNVNLPQVYQQAFGNPYLKLRTQRYSIFGQDTWKVRPNITVNYGLRYFLDKEAAPVPLDKNNFQPRFGISWDVFNNAKTVLRAGGGIFTGTVDNQIVNVANTLASDTQPYSLNIITSSIQSPGITSAVNIYQTLLAQGVIGTRTIRASDITQFGLSTAPGRPLEARIRLGENFKSPETYQASAAIQQNLGYGISAEVSYLFVHGANIVRPSDVRQYRTNPTPVTCPNGSVQITGCYSGQTRLSALNPLIVLDAVYSSSANSSYNAGTLVVTKRFSNNFSLNANYTLSKSIDEVTDYNTDFLAQNPLNRRDDRSLSAFDQRHKVVISGVLNSSSSNIFLKDFVLSPIFNYGSGRPFNLVLGFDDNGDGRTLSDRPAGVGRNTGKGDSYYSLDFRLARRFLTKEQRYLELTFEGFNIFNTVNYNGINNVIGTACVANLATNPNCTNPTLVIPYNARGIRGNSPTQPLGFTAASAARQLQFGVRYNF